MQSPYIQLKIPQFLANSPFDPSESREPAAGVFSASSGGVIAPPIMKGTKYFISGIKCAFILFQQSVSVYNAFLWPER